MNPNTMPDNQPNDFRAWHLDNISLELYRYWPREPEKLPAHCHDDYQLCLSVSYPSEYLYRKSVHRIPVGSLSIIHPGELHGGTGQDIGDRQTSIEFRMLYIPTKTVWQAIEETEQRPKHLPFFSNFVICKPNLFQSFLHFHRTSQAGISRLSQDLQLQTCLGQLIQQESEYSLTPRSTGEERAAVRQVCEYLHEHYAENISLPQLAQLVNLSPSYLSRVFKAEIGVSLPHYQTQIRIDRARSMLLQGLPVKQVAANTGFVDQSHLTYHFKRFVQTTPGRYRAKNRKNLQAF